MSTTLLDRTARLLDLPPQQLGPLQEKGSHGEPRGFTVLTDRGKGTFHRDRRGGPSLHRS
jgi:hypothetical protein